MKKVLQLGTGDNLRVIVLLARAILRGEIPFIQAPGVSKRAFTHLRRYKLPLRKLVSSSYSLLRKSKSTILEELLQLVSVIKTLTLPLFGKLNNFSTSVDSRVGVDGEDTGGSQDPPCLPTMSSDSVKEPGRQSNTPADELHPLTTSPGNSSIDVEPSADPESLTTLTDIPELPESQDLGAPELSGHHLSPSQPQVAARPQDPPIPSHQHTKKVGEEEVKEEDKNKDKDKEREKKEAVDKVGKEKEEEEVGEPADNQPVLRRVTTGVPQIEKEIRDTEQGIQTDRALFNPSQALPNLRVPDNRVTCDCSKKLD